jgi:hypothetical protein
MWNARDSLVRGLTPGVRPRTIMCRDIPMTRPGSRGASLSRRGIGARSLPCRSGRRSRNGASRHARGCRRRHLVLVFRSRRAGSHRLAARAGRHACAVRLRQLHRSRAGNRQRRRRKLVRPLPLPRAALRGSVANGAGPRDWLRHLRRRTPCPAGRTLPKKQLPPACYGGTCPGPTPRSGRPGRAPVQSVAKREPSA